MKKDQKGMTPKKCINRNCPEFDCVRNVFFGQRKCLICEKETLVPLKKQK